MDAHLRDIERRVAASGSALDDDALDRARQRMGDELSPPRAAAYRKLQRTIIEYMMDRHGATFFEKPSPVPERMLLVTWNGARIWAASGPASSFETVMGRELRRYFVGDSDADEGIGYMLMNVAGGLLFVPVGFEPEAGDELEIVALYFPSDGTEEDARQGILRGKKITWKRTYGIIEITFTLTPTSEKEA